jgi:hypothetical protein
VRVFPASSEINKINLGDIEEWYRRKNSYIAAVMAKSLNSGPRNIEKVVNRKEEQLE